jgi:hypothetical protein
LTVSWIELGHLGACIKTLKAGVSQAVMAGQVKHVKLFRWRHAGPTERCCRC